MEVLTKGFLSQKRKNPPGTKAPWVKNPLGQNPPIIIIRGFCPTFMFGGFCPKGFCLWGVLSCGFCIRGVLSYTKFFPLNGVNTGIYLPFLLSLIIVFLA